MLREVEASRAADAHTLECPSTWHPSLAAGHIQLHPQGPSTGAWKPGHVVLGGPRALEAAGCQLETGTAPRSGSAGWGHWAGPNGESGGTSPARPPHLDAKKSLVKSRESSASTLAVSSPGHLPNPSPPKTTKSPYTFKGPIVLIKLRREFPKMPSAVVEL